MEESILFVSRNRLPHEFVPQARLLIDLRVVGSRATTLEVGPAGRDVHHPPAHIRIP